MAAIRGSDGIVSIDGATVASVRSFTLDTTQDTLETSVMGTTARSYIKGMRTFTGSMDIVIDDTDHAWTESASLDIFTHTGANTAVILYPEGDNTGDIAISGTVIITGFSINQSYDGLVEATASFQGTGDVVFGTK